MQNYSIVIANALKMRQFALRLRYNQEGENTIKVFCEYVNIHFFLSLKIMVDICPYNDKKV